MTANAPASPRHQSQRTVLIVDDDLPIVETLRDILGDWGYRVLTAVNGAALPLALAERPDLILLDLMMPGMDGPEVSRRIRAQEGGASRAPISIIVMSAWTPTHPQAAGVVCDGWLLKPFDLDDLAAALERVLAAARGDKEE